MKFNTLTFCLLTLFLSFGFTSYGQNFKKIFRNLKKDRTEIAIKELYSEKGQTYSAEDLALFRTAESIILNTESKITFDPFLALKTINQINNTSETKLDIYLKKYGFSINNLRKSILENILQEAKEGGTEADFEKALEVCKNCSFKEEVKVLKENAAYEEMLSANSINGYKYFLDRYPDSHRLKKVQTMLIDREYYDATTDISLEKLEYFLNRYGFNQHTEQVTHLRDSMAFIQTPKNYHNYKKYISKYPSSKQASEAKKLLPQLLFQKATNSDSIADYKLFLKEFPKDEHLPHILEKLEKKYWVELQKSATPVLIQDFKKLFPNSSKIESVDELLSEIYQNSDWVVENLKGQVKSISYRGTYKGESSFELIKEFDELGNLKLSSGDSYWDELEDIENDLNPREFTYETRIIKNFGATTFAIAPRSKFSSGSGGESEYTLEYDEKNKLSSVRIKYQKNYSDVEGLICSFHYNSNGKLFKKISDGYEIHYEWNGNNLASKKVYLNEDGSRYYSYQIESNLQNIFITEIRTSNRGGTWVREITMLLDNKGRIVKREIKNLKGKVNSPILSYQVNKYSYDQSGNLVKTTGEYQYLHDRSNRMRLGSRSWNNIIRDDYGNILRVKSKKENYLDYGAIKVTDNSKQYDEWEYIFDQNGNWISRTKYKVNQNDITVKTKVHKVTRNISYYNLTL